MCFRGLFRSRTPQKRASYLFPPSPIVLLTITTSTILPNHCTPLIYHTLHPSDIIPWPCGRQNKRRGAARMGSTLCSSPHPAKPQPHPKISLGNTLTKRGFTSCDKKNVFISCIIHVFLFVCLWVRVYFKGGQDVCK